MLTLPFRRSRRPLELHQLPVSLRYRLTLRLGRRFLLVAAVLACSLGLATLIFFGPTARASGDAGSQDLKNYSPAHYSIPISEKVITGTLDIADCAENESFRVREGGMIIVKGPGYHYGFIPVLTEAGDVTFDLYRIKTIAGPDGGEFARSIGHVSAAVGHFTFDAHRFDLPFDLQVNSVDERPLQARPERTRLTSAASGSCCALSCDGVLVCGGCGVDTGCGFCCSGSCCDEQPSGPLQRHGLRVQGQEPEAYP